MFFADPVVALLFENLHKFGSAVFDDPAAIKYVNKFRLDVIEDSLVVSDDQHARAVPRGHAVDPLGYDANRVDIQPAVGLVQDRECRLKHRELKDFGSL